MSWHLEHEDGTPWSPEELDGVIEEGLRRSDRYPDSFSHCQYVCITDEGEPMLLDGNGLWWSMYSHRKDVKVVLDG